jgi:hypothetical protein
MTHPPQSPRSPKKPRRIQPKIVGHTAATPRLAGAGARSSLRALAPASSRPAVRPPVGAPGMRGFPRARVQSPARGGSSVARAAREQAAREVEAAAAPAPELLEDRRPPRRRPGPARPAVTGRPTTPDEAPLDHAPAAERPEPPPLDLTPRAPVQLRPSTVRSRPDLWPREPSRPRPSRMLAEMHAELADEAAAAE